MALEVTLKTLHLPGLKKARLQFRGVCYYSEAVKRTKSNELVVFDEKFEWLLATPLADNETLCVDVWVKGSSWHKSKEKGKAFLSLCEVSRAPGEKVRLQATVCDANIKPMDGSVHLDAVYTSPEMYPSFFTDEYETHSEDEPLVDSVQSDSPDAERARSKKKERFKTMIDLMRFKSRARDSDTDDMEAGTSGTQPQHNPGPSRPYMEPSTSRSYIENEVTIRPSYPLTPKYNTPITRMCGEYELNLRPQDYQVSITLLEARHLVGITVDPVVCIQVGNQKKFSAVKDSTSCPYYNEYFVFDFHMPAMTLFDKIITLSMTQARNMFKPTRLVGNFKLDVATVWRQPDHQFHHKWAMFTDPKDMWSGPKGYLKCDIHVNGKGVPVKIPPKSELDEDDIDSNLILPYGMTSERQRSMLIVGIYRADGLPQMFTSILSNVKKVFNQEEKDLVDAYIEVTFAGATGYTTVRRNCYNPVWNEEIIFPGWFPPLCQRITIKLMNRATVKPTVIATFHIDLRHISSQGEDGFLPSFGPASAHVYGSVRDYTLVDEDSHLNEGLGEGVSYRAKLLVSVRTVLLEPGMEAGSTVKVQPCDPPPEKCTNKEEDFFLFCSIFDATMIDKKFTENDISFEMSIGNYGNTIDGYNQSSRPENDHQGRLDKMSQSVTPSVKALSHDKINYFLPYWDKKPCAYTLSSWPEYTRRMFLSNIIEKIAESFEEDLHKINVSSNDDLTEMLKEALEKLHNNCSRFEFLKGSPRLKNTCFMTDLDRNREKLCSRELEYIAITSNNLKAVVSKSTFEDRLKIAHDLLLRLQNIIEDPQGSIPDVIIWAITGTKRFAYQRMKARHLIYSPSAEEKGKLCGKTHTMFLKLPGKKGERAGIWNVPMKVQWYIWFGHNKFRQHYTDGLPGGCDTPIEPIPPRFLVYSEHHNFQLRCHIYQARSLLGSDASGLSDPFARVIADEYCRTTRVIDQTLSPTWDQTLLFNDICLFGSLEQLKKDSLTIIIEIFDQDTINESEFIGRTMAKPHIKTLDQFYEKPKFPPSLEWYELFRGSEKAGEVLATFELLETSRGDKGEASLTCDVPELPQFTQDDIIPVPKYIRPALATYRIEVLFWGLRDLKKIHFLKVSHPRVDIECAGNILSSAVIENSQKNPNFPYAITCMNVQIPEKEIYRPPLTIRVIDTRSFGRYTLVGIHMINSIQKYMIQNKDPIEDDDNGLRTVDDSGSQESDEEPILYEVTFDEIRGSNAFRKEEFPLSRRNKILPSYEISRAPREKRKKNKKISKKTKTTATTPENNEDNCSTDWWTKYFASTEQMIKEVSEVFEDNLGNKYTIPKQIEDVNNQPGGSRQTYENIDIDPETERKHALLMQSLFKVYTNELEAQPMFNEFKDWLFTFDLYRGKKSFKDHEDESRVVGSFKGAIKVYKWSPEDAGPSTSKQAELTHRFGLFQGIPSNEPIKVLVRIYIIKAIDLHPMDMNGKADPYVVIKIGAHKINDKENYISKQLNPVFGKCFEIDATFPRDSILTVRIQDWDLVGSDDIIGETKIDLENRFYSKHRATCGLPKIYEEEGLYKWRDAIKPTQILTKLCKDNKLEHPIYEYNRVRIGKKIFKMKNTTNVEPRGRERKADEKLALQVLHRWQEMPKVGCHLVPEHIETRPLFNPEKPGIEQGKLEMWVDMFPMDMPLPGPPVDINPRKPISYELRVIIWNTDDVVLEDDAFFTDQKMSDIYVRGWVTASKDCQCTDIHYRSLTGEGNFNWRFVFPFEYLAAEEKIVITRKETMISWDETMSKIPARLALQVWDADHFSADDFLGAIILDLNRFPRGAKTAKLCTLDMLKTDGSVPMVSIFKQKRIKGWWPFFTKKNNDEMELTGKVEAEIELVTKEVAEKNPVGLGRSGPEPLDKPSRPDASFMWFMNPLKSIKYIIWHNYKWKVLKFLAIMGLTILMLLFIYAFPGYTVKKFIGA